MRIPFQRIDAGLPVPRHAVAGDAGVDLYAADAVTLDPGDRSIVPTGVAVAIPNGFVGLVTPRSGLAARSGISIVNTPGVVDSGYRGEIKVILVNLGSKAVQIERGDRIAQLVVVAVEVQEWLEVDDLSSSERGTGGFGSTGS